MQAVWPKPGEQESSPKVSYVKGCDVEGNKYVLGMGVYAKDEAEADRIVAEGK